MNKNKPAIVKSASRALDIIEFVVKNPKPPTFSAILDYMDIPKSSLSYLLQDLLNREYLQIDSDTRVYYPGLKLIQVSAACINNTNVSQEIWQGIKILSDTLGGETAHAAILEGRYAVYIAKCQGTKDLSAVSNIGFRIPAHTTGVGKVLLSSLSEEELAARLANVELERYTEKTIVSYPAIAEELKVVAEQGYAIDNQEIIPGGVCVAAPIYDKTHKMIAAISATVSAMRLTDDLLQELIRKVKAAGVNISMRLGKV
ncbi:IclR family transcriptional regulator [Sporomusa termitida]|uniref:HTH-type transcriptional repressor AllR n=1 Tax=Sporomusa termitida TaxID=2377 RepID=A0A517DW32_9FIRM|nr:IclR family transcriptional regulator [Sporomusa termitida]QDR81565.1 HTH-type transcriptional repressor AllR [Sporomusa termitida]